MSIYATIGSIYVTKPYLPNVDPENIDDLLEIYIQGVPEHIQHTGPDWDFLPPPIPETDGRKVRAVFFCAPWTQKTGQKYINPLFMMTGEEWETTPFKDIYYKIENEVNVQFPLYYHMVLKEEYSGS